MKSLLAKAEPLLDANVPDSSADDSIGVITPIDYGRSRDGQDTCVGEGTDKSLPATPQGFAAEALTALVLAASLVAYALETAAIKRLTDEGTQNCSHEIELYSHGPLEPGRQRPSSLIVDNPVSAFNILVWGNAVVCVALMAVWGRREALAAIKRMTTWDIAGITAGSFLYSACTQCFLYLALQQTTAINVAVLTRLEPVIIMVLCRVLLKEIVPLHNALAAIVSLIGIAAAYLWAPLIHGDEAVRFGAGELCAAAAAFCLGTSSIISKTMLKRVPLGLFMIARTSLGTVLFAILGLLLGEDEASDQENEYEPEDSQSTAQPSGLLAPWAMCGEAWRWILVYAALSLVSTVLWFAGVQRASAQTISLVVSFGFVLTLAVDYVALGETPTESETVGASIIVLSLMIAQTGDCIERRRTTGEKLAKNTTNGSAKSIRSVSMLAEGPSTSLEESCRWDVESGQTAEAEGEAETLSWAEAALSASRRSIRNVRDALDGPAGGADAPMGLGVLRH
jgi:drug/metabolite transporter (DMT)-like permease